MKVSGKHEDLELLRGCAALGVIVYHFNRGFLPPDTAPQAAHHLGLAVEPPFLMPLINGPFMVAIFFVLSSYALTFKLVGERRTKATMVAIAKRFPRLVPLTLIGVMFAAILQMTGLMANRQAALLTKSDWLVTTGGVKLEEDWPEPTIFGALYDSLKLFVDGVSQYNAALWTMGYELVGGILALLTALLIAGEWRLLRDLSVVAILGLAGFLYHPLCGLCVGTVLITKFLHFKPIRLSTIAALSMIGAGLLLGTTYEVFEGPLETSSFEPQSERLQWILLCFGSMAVFLGIHLWPYMRNRRWRLGRFLGDISFSTYVLHMPVIATVGSAVVLLIGYSMLSVLLAFLMSIGVTIFLSILVAEIDRWWIGALNDFMRNFTTKKVVLRTKPYASDAP